MVHFYQVLALGGIDVDSSILSLAVCSAPPENRSSIERQTGVAGEHQENCNPTVSGVHKNSFQGLCITPSHSLCSVVFVTCPLIRVVHAGQRAIGGGNHDLFGIA
jgi:hypothetical protein